MTTQKKEVMLMKVRLILFGFLLFLLLSVSAFAQVKEKTEKEDFPTKTVTILVPWAAGGSSDLTARVLAKGLTEIWKQPVIVVNQPGATGVIGSLKLAGSNPDGYILGLISTAIQTTQYISPNPTNRNSYTYIIGVHYDPYTLTVKSDSPWKNLKAFVDYTKANPGKVTHSSSGASSTDKLVSVAFARRSGIQLPDVPFEGYGPALTAVLSGKITSTSVTLANVIPYLKSKDFRVLAVTSERKLPQYPDIPTFIESGIDISWTAWNGILGPKGMSQERISQIQSAIEKVYTTREWKEFMATQNFQPFTLIGNQFKSYVDGIDPSLKEMIEEAGLVRAK